jgi:hypothetical protein
MKKKVCIYDGITFFILDPAFRDHVLKTVLDISYKAITIMKAGNQQAPSKEDSGTLTFILQEIQEVVGLCWVAVYINGRIKLIITTHLLGGFCDSI